MSFENAYWNSKQVDILYKAENPEHSIIQPIIAKHVEDLTPSHILDYGCGDAFMAQLLSPSIKIDLFDRNQDSLDKVFLKLQKENCRRLFSEDEFPVDFYDCIVLSFVLICVDTTDDQIRILKKLRNSLNSKSGHLIVANTHPCFLQYEFTAFKTNYNPDNFNYHNNGELYDVYIKQPHANPSVKLTDYKWQLSFWINTAIECGFELEEIIEVPDAPYKNLVSNKLYPPFLIMKFK